MVAEQCELPPATDAAVSVAIDFMRPAILVTVQSADIGHITPRRETAAPEVRALLQVWLI